MLLFSVALKRKKRKNCQAVEVRENMDISAIETAQGIESTCLGRGAHGGGGGSGEVEQETTVFH